MRLNFFFSPILLMLWKTDKPPLEWCGFQEFRADIDLYKTMA
jgi:hypothetical protein